MTVSSDKIAEGQFVSVIHSDWELLRLSAHIHEIPANRDTCFVFMNTKEMQLSLLMILH